MIVINNIYNNVSKQGLGNRLFQYCWAREIAERKNYTLHSPPIIGFPITYRQLDGIEKYENTIITPEATQLFDMSALYNHDGQIIVSGYSQRYEYYIENKEKIKNWLFIEGEELYEKPDEDDIVLNVRLGDYINLGWDIDMNYYIKILNSESYKNAIIICDEPNNQKLNVLRDMGCLIKDNSIHGDMKFIADFVYVKHSKKCIISNSTFSWWASFLGQAETIYFPCFKFPWVKDPKKNDVDLRVYDEKRYRFIYE